MSFVNLCFSPGYVFMNDKFIDAKTLVLKKMQLRPYCAEPTICLFAFTHIPGKVFHQQGKLGFTWPLLPKAVL